MCLYMLILSETCEEAYGCQVRAPLLQKDALYLKDGLLLYLYEYSASRRSGSCCLIDNVFGRIRSLNVSV